MAGIYLHIPFCKRKCHYCNFYSLASHKYVDAFVSALMGEIVQRKEYLGNAPVKTIYFGGGTPSLLGVTTISTILEKLYTCFIIDPNAEITLEANPDDITTEKLKSLKQTGVNRLSIGIQSFHDDDLQYLGRSHGAKQAKQSIEQALLADFNNLSIDFIYGIPTLTDKKWEENLQIAFNYAVPHISAYALTVENKTPLDLYIRSGKSAAAEENHALAHYRALARMMREHGYEHYEISNFCLPGQYANHNTAYWFGEPYLGLGPSAHSFNGGSRCWNISNLNTYINSIKNGEVEQGQELLDTNTRYNEYIMTGLRTQWGCNLAKIENDFGKKHSEYLKKESERFIQTGQMIKQHGNLILTDEGRLFADRIASELFIV